MHDTRCDTRGAACWPAQARYFVPGLRGFLSKVWKVGKERRGLAPVAPSRVALRRATAADHLDASPERCGPFGELVEGLDWRLSTPMGLSRLYMPVTRLDGAAQASALELSLSPCPALTRLLRVQQRRT